MFIIRWMWSWNVFCVWHTHSLNTAECWTLFLLKAPSMSVPFQTITYYLSWSSLAPKTLFLCSQFLIVHTEDRVLILTKWSSKLLLARDGVQPHALPINLLKKKFSYKRVHTTRDSKILHVRTTPKAQNRTTPTPWKWSIKTHWCPVSSSADFEVGPKVPLAQSSSASDNVRSFLSHENLPDSFLKSVAPVHHEEVLYLLQHEDRR